MKADNSMYAFNSFLTEYILSLAERTRWEKVEIKLGFDHLIYNLALSKDWQPARLSFLRQNVDGKITSKSEAEFGVDSAFINSLGTELYVFVLKDEALTNSNWTKHGFDTDIRMAACPDIEMPGFDKIRMVKIILAYNKDEDSNGIELYNRLVNSLGKSIGDHISLVFERWNISMIVGEVKNHLMSPGLMPLHLSREFTELCMEVKNCDYGTKAWDDRVVADWKKFLNSLLANPLDIRKINLIPVSLFILHNYRKDDPNSYAGWLDLTEYAIIAIWNSYQSANHDGCNLNGIRYVIERITVELYLAELTRYVNQISAVINIEHGFGNTGKGRLSIVNDPYVTYWHTSRLAILAIGCRDFSIRDSSHIIMNLSKLVAVCMSTNPSIFRPLIDLNHIDLFLIWWLLLQLDQQKHIYTWLSQLESRLTIRRSRHNHDVPFIESGNRIELVAEYIATSNRPPEYTDTSSYLVLMLLEMCFYLGQQERDELLERYYRRVVIGIGDDGNRISDYCLDLLSWVPPEDWARRILVEKVDDGIGIAAHNFSAVGDSQFSLAERIQNFIKETRIQYPWQLPKSAPYCVIILACLKHGSPLPPEYWRSIIFPQTNVETEPSGFSPQEDDKSVESY